MTTVGKHVKAAQEVPLDPDAASGGNQHGSEATGKIQAPRPGPVARANPRGLVPGPLRSARSLLVRVGSADVPARLRMFTGLCLLLTVALGAVCVTAAAGARSTWSTVAVQQAPQVVDATGLYQALTDLDAQTANIMMFGAGTQLSGNRATALAQYTADRTIADRDLQRATLDAAGNAGVQQALGAVLDAMGSYQDLAGRALVLNDSAHAPAGRPDAAALAQYRKATDLMRTVLLPAADRLVQANNDAFNRTYTRERSALGAAEWWTAVLGAAVLVVLVALQVWLARRFQRIVNPPLAAATLLVAVFLALGGSLLSDQAAHLRYARRDAFDSVVALTRARAVVYDANADESRYLLDQQRAPQYQDAFEADSQQILALPDASITSYDTDLAAAVSAYRANHDEVGFGGFYGTELRNITFLGERAAAEQTLASYQVYQRDDRTIRALVDGGHLQQAIAYCTSYAPDGSNAAFSAHDAALQKLIGINTAAFTSAVSAGRGEVSVRIPLLAGAAALVMVLCLLGVRPRLAEFRG
jgi:hypothetical protein